MGKFQICVAAAVGNQTGVGCSAVGRTTRDGPGYFMR